MAIVKVGTDTLQPETIIRNVKELKVYEDIRLRRSIALGLLGTFIFSVISTTALIALWGLGYMHFTLAFIRVLIGATIAEIGTCLR